MTSVGAVVDSLFDNFSSQLAAYDELIQLAERELVVLDEETANADALQGVVEAKKRAMARIDELMQENRHLREEGAAASGVAEFTLSALEKIASGHGVDPRGGDRAGQYRVGDVRRVVEQLAERIRTLDDVERRVEEALLTVRDGVKQQMKRVHTGQDVLGAYRRAAWRPGDSHFMDRKR